LTRGARVVGALLLSLTLGACAAGTPDDDASPATSDALDRPAVGGSDRTEVAPDASVPNTTPPPDTGSAVARPSWLGTRALPLAPDGFGQRLPTPPELTDRRLATPPLPDPVPTLAPADGFAASIAPIPTDVLARSTWGPDCPVSVEELRYLALRFVGFDGLTHTGELIVHRDVAKDVVDVFAELHAARFPLEEVRVISRADLAAPATGDGNVTSSFVCRPTVGGSRWSEHAFGRAIDLNPFHNPYVRDDLILPELAGSYVDRNDVRPGMIVAGDVVTQAFARIGWGWGGDWTGRATDPMHFSSSGR
jgi:hypothetical protein